jgi:hypothetical protein
MEGEGHGHDPERTAPDASARYAEREKAIAAAIEKGTQDSTRVSLGRVVTFLLGVALLAVYAREHGLVFLALGLLCVVAFVILVGLHNRIEAKLEREKAAALYVSRGKKRLVGDLASLPARGFTRLGARYPDHPYAADLDVVGPSSLLSLLDVVETDLSEARLVDYLATPAPLEQANVRQGGAREIARDPAFVEDLFVLSPRVSTSKEEAERFFAFCRATPEKPSVLLTIVAFGLPLVTLTLVFAAPALGLPGWSWMVSFVLHYVVGFRAAGSGALAVEVGASGARLLGGYSAMIDRTVKAGFESPALTALTATLGGSDREGALSGLAKLRMLAGWAEARENGFFKLFVGPLVLLDLHLGFALARWQRSYGSNVDRWLDALAEVTALAGLGTFAYEHPTAVFPEFTDEPCFEAEQLAHPLLPPSRVPNDVTIDGRGHALLVTGSNMSGKSTLMRSMGVAVVMALAGAPVLATRFRVSRLVVRTSMRVKDSLSSGVSHFYAELLALRRVVEGADRGEPVFFLLDEILHGTNSRERHLGAKGVILHLLDRGALGAVSTHDLGLADLVEEGGDRVHAVHLVEQTANGKMTFDHKLREGFLTSGNALRLMRDMGLPVPAEAPATNDE